MYKIKDLQFEDRYFAVGATFKDLKEVCEHLISYHSIDTNMSNEEALLSENKIKECWESLRNFEWDLEEI